VAILGGGIGGLSAAHELGERGFDVTVYEAGGRLGGKARSFTARQDAAGRSLPGEHGFRFFPGFYRNLRDTMARTPTPDGDTTADRLVGTRETLITSVSGPEYVSPSTTPSTIQGWLDAFKPTIGGGELSARETNHFLRRLLSLLTSGRKRRHRHLDRVTWWTFLDADERSAAYRKHLCESTQALVAMRPRIASARTIGQIYVQLMLDQIGPDRPSEAVLNGPTSTVWIDPWERYLRSLGVRFELAAPVTAIESDGHDVTGVRIDGDRTVTADYYVAAVPVEVMRELVTPALERAAPSLGGLANLDTAWMNGLQFYLSEDVPLATGHQAYTDSPWALTAISQRQFWDAGAYDLTAWDDGAVQGVLSVIISDWETPGSEIAKPARECTREEIRTEVWRQLTDHLNREEPRLTEDLCVDWVLDPAIDPADEESVATNQAPLLINTVGSLRHRPRARTAAPSLVLAADYVRTETDLATMESANEAARRAVRAIVHRSDVDATPPAVWGLAEPTVFEPLQRQDDVAFKLGLPHPSAAEGRLRRLVRRFRPGGPA
jgi:uncharacterized protein with NAD-binding domain and iron-sulfur cluster